MFEILNKPIRKSVSAEFNFDDLFSKIKEIYGYYEVEDDRKNYLKDTIKKFGYLPYPHFNTLDELTSGEILVAFEQKLINEGVYDGEKFSNFKNPSPLSRYSIKNSNWFKKEGHNIKLLSLLSLSDGNKNETATFITWLSQVISLPMGNRGEGVLPTTLYLIPFHPRAFECAYLPESSEVDIKLEDFKMHKFLGLDVKAQVQLFIQLTQLAGHSVIYDILPQTARFSKTILTNPFLARWVDVNELSFKIEEFLNVVCSNIQKQKKFKKQDIETTKITYIHNLFGGKKRYTNVEKPIFERIEEDMKEYKILISYQMSFKKNQKKLVERVSKIIENVNGTKVLSEDDIVSSENIVDALIKNGLWTLPGGAWNSSSVPIFEKIHESKKYPVFKHYNSNGEDVSKFANLDCQTPYYFAYFESQKYNSNVVEFFVKKMEDLAYEFNFDGFRVDHIDHVVDDISEQNGFPISYRCPSYVLGKLNNKLKRNCPYFATLAEYMLWDDFYFQYHKDMNFDCLWGNDIICQNSKTPSQIIKDNEKLSHYNKKYGKKYPLSILKTYNNQDGEFRDINQYPGQLKEEGALFKWFKYKFLPGGDLANRPTLYIDGDESFTKNGIEHIIGHYASMVREKNWSFYEKFDAINRFVEKTPLILNGKATLLNENEYGLSSWIIEKDDIDYKLLIVSNYFAPTELKDVVKEDGSVSREMVKGNAVLNSDVEFGKDYKIVSYFDFVYDENQKLNFVQKPLIDEIYSAIHFDIIQPSEFKVYRIIKN